VGSFLLLTAVQFFLVSNTYELKNERFYFAEKNFISENYWQAIRNDKLFPGGQKIIDSFINKDLNQLERLYKNNRPAFETFRQRLADTIFNELRKKESIRDLLSQVKKKRHITDSLQYALMIESLSVLFDNNNYVTIFDKHEHYPLINAALQENKGIRIGGTLRKPNELNWVTGISVGSAERYSYRISFTLYVEPQNRQAIVMRQMGLTFSLSVLSIIIIIVLFYIAFKNWVRQKKLSEMKSDFINNITHEFHTPLSAIIIAGKSLQNEKIIDKKQNIRPLADVIQRQSERLRTLIDQVLGLVATNKLVLNKKDHSLHDLLDEILLDYRLNFTDGNIKLCFDRMAVRDRVRVDRFHFTTVVLNILDNAIKYNNNEVKEIHVSTSEDSNYFQIMIRDNGIGMEPDIREHIFDKFYRNTAGVAIQAKGLGLGLYYVKQSVDAHGWEMMVESRPGKSTTFTIRILFESHRTDMPG
jgi:two-component system phosphate regulon sensor histidine kinase PhoR